MGLKNELKTTVSAYDRAVCYAITQAHEWGLTAKHLKAKTEGRRTVGFWLLHDELPVAIDYFAMPTIAPKKKILFFFNMRFKSGKRRP